MGINFTEKQQQVIDTRGCNLLVSAAAGSGKTAVLVERIVRMVSDGEHPVDIDRLLVVTFTNAAAAEMRERISRALNDRLAADPENEHLQKQTTLLHNARITTIDSFCLFVLRNQFHTIGLDPGFRIAEEGEARLIRQEALEEVLEAGYASGKQEFLYCMEYFSSGSRDTAVEEIVLKLYDFAMSTPFPEQWLEERKQDYCVVDENVAGSVIDDSSIEEGTSRIDFDEIPWVRDLMRQTRLILEGCREKLQDAVHICEEPDGPYMYGEVLEREREMVEYLLRRCGENGDGRYDDLYSAFASVKFDRLPSRKDGTVSNIKREVVKNIRTDVKEKIGDLQKRFFFKTKEQVMEQMKVCRAAVEALIDLTIAFKETFDAKKRDKNILDFNDIEHFALSILVQRDTEDNCVPTETALEYRSHFHEILIDEYQDSNLVQEYILSCISGEEDGRYNRFMVGDVKQSIYKFRLARPELFLEKYLEYGAQGGLRKSDAVEEETVTQCGLPEEEREQPDGTEKLQKQPGKDEILQRQPGKDEILQKKPGKEETLQGKSRVKQVSARRIDLHQNFRSRVEVLNTVNTVFAQIMGQDVGGIVYDDLAALHSGAVYPAQGENTIAKGRNPNATELLLFTSGERREEAADIRPGADEGEQISVKEQEAYGVAAKIRELMREFQVTDKESGALRRVCYRDIVILLRTTSGWDEVFKRVLEEEGIPVHMTSRTGYFAASEVQELLHFLRILDNPLQDIPLYGVLHSYLGGFGEEEIAVIRAAYPQGKYLYDALQECAGQPQQAELVLQQSELQPQQTEPEPQQTGLQPHQAESEPQLQQTEQQSQQAALLSRQLVQKIRNFLERINRYRNLAVYLSVQELLQTILRETDYLNYVAVKPEGARRRANVEMLLIKAADYEKTSYFGLYYFLRYMEQLEKYEVDYGEASLLDENADVVRIMSIHKSKGLEFPVCFVSGLAKSFQTRDTNGHLVLDIDTGIGVDYVNPDMRVRNRDLRRNVIAGKMRADNLAEEMRILYVAMTRAKEKLILTGTVKSPVKTAVDLFPLWKKETTLLPYDILLDGGSFLDLLLHALARNKCMDTFYRECGLESEQSNPLYNQDMSVEVMLSGWEDTVEEKLEETVRLEERKRKLLLSDCSRDVDTALMTRLSDSFIYHYPYENLQNLYTKTTVSELKMAGMQEETDFSFRMYEEETVVPYLPGFLEKDESVSGSMRGSAYHKVMELFDFAKLTSEVTDDRRAVEELMKQELEQMRHDGRLSDDYYAVVSVPKIVTFLMSETAARMGVAARDGRLYKEQPFVLGLPANRLSQDFPGEETVLIQGIIDVFFEEEERFVLLDYKTDAVKTAEELTKRYHVQLDYYAEALEQYSGCKNTEKILYSFKLGEEIHLPGSVS